MQVKFKCLITVALLLTLLLSSTVLAAPGDTKALAQNADATNTYISSSIDRAVAAADRALAICKAQIDTQLQLVALGTKTMEEAQVAIAALEAVYQNQIDAIAASLIKNTDRRAFLLITAGERYSIEIISEYVAVQLGDKEYMVDPLRIVGN